MENLNRILDEDYYIASTVTYEAIPNIAPLFINASYEKSENSISVYASIDQDGEIYVRIMDDTDENYATSY